eukprot:12404924-Ditylum_brightwellii.AAC.1
MKSSWSSAFIASLLLRTLGFAFVPATNARGWNSFISPLGSEERCSDTGDCGIPGGDETVVNMPSRNVPAMARGFVWEGSNPF